MLKWNIVAWYPASENRLYLWPGGLTRKRFCFSMPKDVSCIPVGEAQKHQNQKHCASRELKGSHSIRLAYSVGQEFADHFRAQPRCGVT